MVKNSRISGPVAYKCYIKKRIVNSAPYLINNHSWKGILILKTVECVISLPQKRLLHMSKSITIRNKQHNYQPMFLHIGSTGHLEILREKEKLLVTKQFPFSHSIIYPFGHLHAFIIKFKTVVCKVFEFGPV